MDGGNTIRHFLCSSEAQAHHAFLVGLLAKRGQV